MKNTKINLLTYKANYQNLEKYFAYFRYSVIGLSIIFFGVVLYFLASALTLNGKISNLESRKANFLQALIDKKENEAKILFIQKKYQAMEKFLEDDAKFSPYYNLLVSTLSSSTESARLKSFQIDKERNIDFWVTFNNFREMAGFFEFVESEKFLSNFEKLSLKSFNTVSDKKQQENYELSFYGKFINIDEKTD
jgi:hypothetical protein